jgi:ubiquinone/menaquinone biosynthesis C-methylase UbiE
LSLESKVWRSVIQAIEAAIPEYDAVNDRVSLGLAQKARKYAVHEFQLKDEMTILDAGIGPGTMSETILRKNPRLTIVGLDASVDLLRAARERLESTSGDNLHLVRGVFESLPFAEKSFSRIISAFAFRDARNRGLTIDEFYRVCTEEGIFTVVDLGKPENHLKRVLISIWVHYLTPIIARASMSANISGNPWRLIFPTYQALGSNQEVVSALGKRFSRVMITEFALGGMIVVLAFKEITKSTEDRGGQSN